MKRALNWEIQRQNAMKQRQLLLEKLQEAGIPFRGAHSDIFVVDSELTPEQRETLDKIIKEFTERNMTDGM